MGRATVEVFTASVCTQYSAMANYVRLTVLFVLVATLAAASGSDCGEGFNNPWPGMPRLCMHFKKLDFHVTYKQAGEYCAGLKAGLPRFYNHNNFKKILKKEVSKDDDDHKKFWLMKQNDKCFFSSYLRMRPAPCPCTPQFTHTINSIVCFKVKSE